MTERMNRSNLWPNFYDIISSNNSVLWWLLFGVDTGAIGCVKYDRRVQPVEKFLLQMIS
jgi:hypothetical protein